MHFQIQSKALNFLYVLKFVQIYLKETKHIESFSMEKSLYVDKDQGFERTSQLLAARNVWDEISTSDKI